MSANLSSPDTPTTGPSPLDVCFLLARADAEVRRRFDRTLSGWHGLSRNDFTILRALADAPSGRLRRVDLAERLGVTASGVTRLLLPLEKLGLIARLANPDDARVALAELTDAGRQLVADAGVTADEVAEGVLGARFTAAEVATLGQLLTKLSPPVV